MIDWGLNDWWMTWITRTMDFVASSETSVNESTSIWLCLWFFYTFFATSWMLLMYEPLLFARVHTSIGVCRISANTQKMSKWLTSSVSQCPHGSRPTHDSMNPGRWLLLLVVQRFSFPRRAMMIRAPWKAIALLCFPAKLWECHEYDVVRVSYPKSCPFIFPRCDA